MDLNNFGPLAAETWGTISDWAMVFVTSLTAYFLWRTLKSQTIVQESQQKITTIETNRYISSIKPKFGFARENRMTSRDGETYAYKFQCLDNDAKFVTLECKETNPDVFFLIDSDMQIKSLKNEWEHISANEVFYVTIKYQFKNPKKDRATNFYFNYEDTDGNTYTQKVSFSESYNFPVFSNGYERRISQ